ncbi:MAG: extracellular solute-binding protein [Bacilli bacterium]|jgi:ABC-type glycerol-3-phosphate transport system substrate-binding protein|nr:extracellular solute-binding protein [Bacilli bacterium]
MTKLSRVVTASALSVFLLSCQAKGSSFGQASDEILTYDRPDTSKTQLVISGNGIPEALVTAFEKANPTIQVIEENIAGGEAGYHPYYDWIKNGDGPDILYFGATAWGIDTSYLEDLTSKPYLSTFDASTILQNTTDGHVYLVPGPVSMGCILYNKTLFTQYGWQVPTTTAEFLTLCDKITADTNGQVAPFNPNGKYDQEFFKTFEIMNYQKMLAGTTNRAWLEDYRNGKAVLKGHIDPMFTLAQSFADHGALNDSHFDYSYTTRTKEFRSGKIAMINDYLGSTSTTDNPDVSAMPFPSENGEDRLLLKTPKSWLGVTKNSKRTTAVEKAADTFLTFYASNEGQQTLLTGNEIPATKNPTYPDNDLFNSVKPYIEKNQTVTAEYFDLPFSVREYSPMKALRQGIRDMINKTKTLDEAVQSVDDDVAAARVGKAADPVIASAGADFTVLETSEMFSDMFQAKSGSQISLVLNNVAYRGNLMRIYQGDFTAQMIKFLALRSLDNNSTLITATMTGQQITDALNHPYGSSITTDDVIADCVYAFKGLKATYAPWNEVGSKILALTLADGSPLELSKTYTVSFWQGTVSTRYYDATTATSTPGTFNDLITAYLKEQSPIKPSKDGRITLSWK